MLPTQAGIQLEKLVTIRLRLLDREINVLFRFQVPGEAFGTHSVQESEIREGKALADVVTTSSNRPSLESYTLAGEVTGEKAKRTRYGERRWAFVVREG
jgi:hypothetical protein